MVGEDDRKRVDEQTEVKNGVYDELTCARRRHEHHQHGGGLRRHAHAEADDREADRVKHQPVRAGGDVCSAPLARFERVDVQREHDRL